AAGSLTLDEAATAVKTGLSLSQEIDINTYDALWYTMLGSKDGEEVYTAMSFVQAAISASTNILLGYASGTSAPTSSPTSATRRRLLQTSGNTDTSNYAFQSLARQFSNSAVDLTSTSTVGTILSDSLVLYAGGDVDSYDLADYVDSTVIDAAAESTSELNSLTSTNVLANSGSGEAVATEVSKSATVTETSMAEGIVGMMLDVSTVDTFVSQYTGDALSELVNTTEVAGAEAIAELSAAANPTSAPTSAPTVPGDGNDDDGDDDIDWMFYGLVGGGGLVGIMLCCLGGYCLMVRRSAYNVIPHDTMTEMARPPTHGGEDDEEDGDVTTGGDPLEREEARQQNSPGLRQGALGDGTMPDRADMNTDKQQQRMDAHEKGKKEREEAERAEFENILKEQQEYIARRLA
ncbi:hypothetical protein CYMTET_18923, partial [Cymbomonas tetramitiformis]